MSCLSHNFNILPRTGYSTEVMMREYFTYETISFTPFIKYVARNLYHRLHLLVLSFLCSDKRKICFTCVLISNIFHLVVQQVIVTSIHFQLSKGNCKLTSSLRFFLCILLSNIDIFWFYNHDKMLYSMYNIQWGLFYSKWWRINIIENYEFDYKIII